VEAHGRIDTTSSPQFGSRLLALVDGGAKTLLVDFAHIAYISSTGFRALLLVGKRCEDQGCRLGLCGLNHEVQRLFEIGVFNDMFQIYPTRPDAITKLSGS
jgi:anti-anti-sigma factor